MFNKFRPTSLVAKALIPCASLTVAPIPALLPAACAQEQLWITQFGTSVDDWNGALASDGAGGVFAGGYMSGNIGDAFLALYDASGNQVWFLEFGSTPGNWNLEDRLYGLASDGSGGVFAGGETGGVLAGSTAGARDSWLARYDRAGNRLWIRQFGTPGHDSATALAPDGEGGVFVCGVTQGSLAAAHLGAEDVWVARYDASGNQLWIRQFGTVESDSTWSAAPDGAKGVFLGGGTGGSLAAPFAGVFDVWIARFDSAGNRTWIRQFGTSALDAGARVASDGAAGAFFGGVTQGNLGGQNAGGQDAFLARYDETGNRLWLKQFGTSSNDAVEAIAPDGAQGVMVAGKTSGALGGRYYGGRDAFLARYDASGNQLWIQQFGTRRDEVAGSLAPASTGRVMVAGYTTGSLGGTNAGASDVFLAQYAIDTCYADCDKSTGNGVLDVFDFLCFQNSFVNSEPYACDCDTSTGNGVCDVFDFLCFQNAFVTGCP